MIVLQFILKVTIIQIQVIFLILFLFESDFSALFQVLVFINLIPLFYVLNLELC